MAVGTLRKLQVVNAALVFGCNIVRGSPLLAATIWTSLDMRTVLIEPKVFLSGWGRLLVPCSHWEEHLFPIYVDPYESSSRVGFSELSNLLLDVHLI